MNKNVPVAQLLVVQHHALAGLKDDVQRNDLLGSELLVAHPSTHMCTDTNLLRHDVEDLSRLPKHCDLFNRQVPKADLETFLVAMLCDLVLRDARQ